MILIPLVDKDTLQQVGKLLWPHVHPPAWHIGQRRAEYDCWPENGYVMRLQVEVQFMVDEKQILYAGASPRGQWVFSTEHLPLEAARKIQRGFWETKE